MTIEEVKKYLNQGFEIQKKIEGLTFKYKNIYSQRSSDDISNSSRNNNTERKLIAGAYIKGRIELLQYDLLETVAAIEQFIEQSNIDEKYQVVLIHRYCYLEVFSKIAEQLNFSQRYVYQLHDRALKKISTSSVSNHLDNDKNN